MLKVGITGGIGSGKTTVCKIFEILGVPVFYADTAAREVMHGDAVLIKEITKAFGKEAYNAEKQLNRKYIAQIVFTDTSQLEKLNSLVHPAVFRAFDKWVSQQKDVAYVLKEAALLFESGSNKMCDKTILVQAPLQLKLQRVTERDKITPSEVLARIDKQFTDEEKAKLSDLIINNNEQELLIPQVLNLHEYFLSL